MKFCFGDIVIVENELIGVIVKSWKDFKNKKFTYEVYVRAYNSIITYDEDKIERYMVRHKYLSDEEKEYQSDTIKGF